jgi:hypothetical protein
MSETFRRVEGDEQGSHVGPLEHLVKLKQPGLGDVVELHCRRLVSIALAVDFDAGAAKRAAGVCLLSLFSSSSLDLSHEAWRSRLAYLTGRTSICMKLSKALMLWMRICVPVFGFITLPSGFVGS